MTVLLALLLNSLWVAAWLHWCFHGGIRHFLFSYIFPKKWRAGRERSDIMTMLHDDFGMFVSAESMAPGFVRGVFSCPGCLSASISVVGMVFVFLSFPLSPWVTPLLWSGGAYLGHRLHRYL